MARRNTRPYRRTLHAATGSTRGRRCSARRSPPLRDETTAVADPHSSRHVLRVACTASPYKQRGWPRELVVTGLTGHCGLALPPFPFPGRMPAAPRDVRRTGRLDTAGRTRPRLQVRHLHDQGLRVREDPHRQGHQHPDRPLLGPQMVRVEQHRGSSDAQEPQRHCDRPEPGAPLPLSRNPLPAIPPEPLQLHRLLRRPAPLRLRSLRRLRGREAVLPGASRPALGD